MPSPIKEMMYEEIKKGFEESPYAFISSFEGLPVGDLSEARRNLEKVAKRSVVVKHSLAKKALAELKREGAEKFLKGNVLLTLAEKDPQMVSKALMACSKANEKFVPAGVIFEETVYDEKFVKALAKLPSRQELLTQVVVRVQSPISGFVMTLNQLVRGLVVALGEVRKKKEAAAAPA